MSKNLKRNNHYVPRFYLRNWSSSEDRKKIYIYRLLVSHKNVPTWEEKSISKTATWRNLYTVYDGESESDFFESELDEKIENRIPKIIEKIERKKKINKITIKSLSEICFCSSL